MNTPVQREQLAQRIADAKQRAEQAAQQAEQAICDYITHWLDALVHLSHTATRDEFDHAVRNDSDLRLNDNVFSAIGESLDYEKYENEYDRTCRYAAKAFTARSHEFAYPVSLRQFVRGRSHNRFHPLAIVTDRWND